MFSYYIIYTLKSKFDLLQSVELRATPSKKSKVLIRRARTYILKKKDS